VRPVRYRLTVTATGCAADSIADAAPRDAMKNAARVALLDRDRTAAFTAGPLLRPVR
jgi:hypothetical protein